MSYVQCPLMIYYDGISAKTTDPTGFEWDQELQMPKLGTARTYSYTLRQVAVPAHVRGRSGHVSFLRTLQNYSVSDFRRGGLTLPTIEGSLANIRTNNGCTNLFGTVLGGPDCKIANADPGNKYTAAKTGAQTDKTAVMPQEAEEHHLTRERIADRHEEEEPTTVERT
ncbi:Hypothetical protein FKW44_013336 [Caligus rogercresseyi]|uniref:Uncharacterized protein n=1 Tax=Caligus rogercresseyi TaxID=217165 RepID=A0A7T8KB81_CALRO|nr:Hypothetical protein FKW44_013336 [Caligus rogercresseyi]